MSIIVFPRQDGSGAVSLIVPAPSAGIPILEIARKDTPIGVPFKIVSDDLLPDDLYFLDAWEVDFSNPDGYGIGCEAWFAEQENKGNKQ